MVHSQRSVFILLEYPSVRLINPSHLLNVRSDISSEIISFSKKYVKNLDIALTGYAITGLLVALSGALIDSDDFL